MEFPRKKDATQEKFVRSDWTEMEDRFRRSSATFRDAIKDGNPECECPWAEEKEEKNEKNQPTGKEGDPTPVEYKEVRSHIGDMAKIPEAPEMPKEQKVTDPFEDSPSTTPQPKEEKAAEDDIFDLGPAPVAESALTPQAGTIAPAPTTAAATVATTATTAPATKPVETPAAPLSAPMETFDQKQFESVMAVVNAILAKAPKVDLDILASQLGDYSVTLNLDSLRENPDILSQKMLEVQAKRDSLHARMLEIAPLAEAMKHAMDFLVKTGIACSRESNDTKRLAQLKMKTQDLWIKHGVVATLYENVDTSYKHLNEQFECISRLVTCQQQRLKNYEFSRGNDPFESCGKSAPPWETPAAPVVVEEKKETPRLDNCQDFVVPSKQSESKEDKGILDF